MNKFILLSTRFDRKQRKECSVQQTYITIDKISELEKKFIICSFILKFRIWIKINGINLNTETAEKSLIIEMKNYYAQQGKIM
jgi:hypothetical protein